MPQEFAPSSPAEPGQFRTVGSLAALSAFRGAFYAAIGARADAVFELSDAVLEHEGKVDSLPELSLEEAFTRGHGSVYGAVNAGRIDPDAVRSAALAEPLPRMRGHIVLAVLPEHRSGKRGPVRLDDRKRLQGILFVLHTGINWRHLPPELGFGSGVTCWRCLKQAT